MPTSSARTTTALDKLREMRARQSSARTDANAIDPSRFLAQRSTTAIRRVETVSPAGGRIFVDPETGERRSEFEPKTGTLARLRGFRDTLLNETLANNPLQRAAAPALRRLAAIASDAEVGDRSALDIIENIGKGAAVGSVLIPDDAAVDPTNPSTGIMIAAALVGAGAEGAVGELSLLRGLGAVAKVKTGTNLGQSAEAALRLFGQGEDLSRLARIGGGAFGGAVTEVGLQTLALSDPEDIVANAGLVGLGGAALGGAIAAVGMTWRTARAAPRAARAFTEEFARKTPTENAQALAGSDLAMRTPPEEAGMGAATEMIQRAERAADDVASVRATASKPTTDEIGPIRLTDARLEAQFDIDTSRSLRERLHDGFRAATESFRASFQFEAAMRRFRSMSGLKELDLSDDFRILRVSFDRAPRLAIRELRETLGPIMNLKGENFSNAWKQFERLVFLRDFAETAERGLKVPGDVPLDVLTRELSILEAMASRPAKEAADAHLMLVRKMREDLIRRGKLDIGSGYDHYVPHIIIEDLAQTDARLVGDIDPERLNYFGGRFTRGGTLQEPTRPTTRRREGSARAISTDYADVMYRALRRFHVDNAIDDFLTDLNENFGLRRADLSDVEDAALSRVGRFKRGEESFRIFQPTGPRFFRAQAVDDEALNVLREYVKEGADISLDDVPELRELLAVGRRKEFILPEAISERLDQFYAPSPFRNTLIRPFLKATSWWKRNTIYWGLSRFFVFQAIGDGVNTLRSNPKAFAHLGRAVSEIFDHYGTPKLSPPQALATLAGGVGGLAVDEALSSDDSVASSILAGAGLGYILGTRRAAGTIRAFSELYDDADKLGAINSGFTFQEEELARRILGGQASALPTRRERPWLRGLDTIATLLSGKAHGDPYAIARVPAEIIERVQAERENVLRFASYIQQVESGIHPRIAAKNSREALVDYGRFTDFENKFIRGFALPFYSFYRHNIPNWIKASVGREGIGTKASVGVAAVGALAAADIAVQAWNETFFPDVERKLDDFRRERFHIILGNPTTREVYEDVHGRPLVLGWEMPYEQALEIFGLARPGYAFSQLFGVGNERETLDFGERARRKAADVAMLKPIANFALDLLTPIVKEPIQLGLNRDLFLDAPIIPERYVGTAEGRKRMWAHFGRTFFRQIREVSRTASEVSGQRFDPLTSAFGLGVPVTRVNLDRDLQGFLHERMADAETETARIQSDWKTRIDDVIFSRETFSRIPATEPEEIQRAISELANDPNDAAAAWRYYMSRGVLASLDRHWRSLSNVERARVFAGLPEWAKTSLVFYLTGGEQIDIFAEDTNVATFLR